MAGTDDITEVITTEPEQETLCQLIITVAAKPLNKGLYVAWYRRPDLNSNPYSTYLCSLWLCHSGEFVPIVYHDE